MYISEIRIENFRCFGEGKDSLVLPLRRGLTALVGENDTGKTAVIDAIRFVLGTRDQEYFRVEENRLTPCRRPRAPGAGAWFHVKLSKTVSYAKLSPKFTAAERRSGAQNGKVRDRGGGGGHARDQA